MHMCMKEGNKDKAGWGNYMLVLDNFLPNARILFFFFSETFAVYNIGK